MWFVSNNTSDFGPVDKNWNGEGGGDREACPIVFHHDLATEIEGRGLTGRLRYVTTINRLEQHFAAHYTPIAEEKLRSLVEAIDAEDFKRQLTDEVIRNQLDPEESALPLNSLNAIVEAVHWINQPIFEEAAGRGPNSWSARFSVDAEVCMLVGDLSFNVSEVSKVLKVSGDATFANGSVDSLKVTSIEALDGDPGRTAWARLNKHQGVTANAELWSRLGNAGVGINSPVAEAAMKAANLVAGMGTNPALEQVAGLVSGMGTNSAMGNAMLNINSPVAEAAMKAANLVAGMGTNPALEQVAGLVSGMSTNAAFEAANTAMGANLASTYSAVDALNAAGLISKIGKSTGEDSGGAANHTTGETEEE
ncbi:hypothetical protein BKP42_55210 [Rhodococcus erythropolis]|nr:hypothetical protein BKP42_55210 [Rhodococcus erythropolis]